MNFFEAQDSARRATRRLVIAYVLATLAIIAGVTLIVAATLAGSGEPLDPAVLVFTALATALLIFGASAYKTARLAGGGGQVARDLGGTQVTPDATDPQRRRLRNVVEEMAIASGVPVPEIYVLEQEAGINAFAAGFTPDDAAIAVTRGTLELLNRDELQGVIAHEFSHVLNGDMRLNIRMMGVLFGIMVLGLIGRMVLRGGWHASAFSSRRNRGGGALAIGLGLVIVGAIGLFVARLLKAAVSRQREYLADASAVQFTRQTNGIANALKKIAGYDRQSWITAADPEEVSHMLFAHGAKFSSMFATHPPLLERIQALEPGFRPTDVSPIDMPATPEDGADEPRTAGFAGESAAAVPGDLRTAIGNPTLEHVLYARSLRQGLPETLYEAAHADSHAWLLVLSLFIGREPGRAAPAFDLLGKQLGDARSSLLRNYYDALLAGSDAWRLPLLEIAFPALRRTPPARLEYLLDLARRLVELDGVIELDEFCLYRVLKRGLDRMRDPGRDRSRPRAGKAAVREAALRLLAVVARAGSDDDARRQRAIKAGLAVFGDWAHDATLPATDDEVGALQASLDVLERMNSAARESMVRAVAATVAADGKLATREAELLRAVCGSLDCPLPPLTGATS